MKQPIRNLFEDDKELEKELPQGHREEFMEKLMTLKEQKAPKRSFAYIYKVAAVILLFISAGYFGIKSINTDSGSTETAGIAAQIQDLEKQYLASIDTEWQNFLAVADDEKLVKRYEKKLEDLNTDYQEISEEFKRDTKNILVIEALVENLQTRLELLKDIQDHINVLNQKNEQYETTI